MQVRSWVSLTLGVIWFAVSMGTAESYAQSAAAPVRPSNQSPGRFQLVPEPGGTLFLLDTATGRIWRYSLVMPADSDIKASVDKMIAAQEFSNRAVFSEVERKALYDKLYQQQKDHLQEVNNPCNGLATCFVEVDRLRLRLGPNGHFASEIVPMK